MRLKLDENFGTRWRNQLQEKGHDVDTVADEHLSGASDVAVLDAAIEAERALVTLDLDFANPIRFPPARTAGIAVLRVRHRPGRSDLDLVVSRLIVGLASGDLTKHLWIVEADRIRQFRGEQADDN